MTAPLPRAGRPRCGKVMLPARERPGFPVFEDDPLPLCGRPAGHNPATTCRSEAALARAAAAQRERLLRRLSRALARAA